MEIIEQRQEMNQNIKRGVFSFVKYSACYKFFTESQAAGIEK